eukprot:6557-Heterococcus_DN1.PRE.1
MSALHIHYEMCALKCLPWHVDDNNRLNIDSIKAVHLDTKQQPSSLVYIATDESQLALLAPIKDSELSCTLINACGSNATDETYSNKAAALAVDALMTPQAVNKSVIVSTANTDSTSTVFTNAKML